MRHTSSSALNSALFPEPVVVGRDLSIFAQAQCLKTASGLTFKKFDMRRASKCKFREVRRVIKWEGEA